MEQLINITDAIFLGHVGEVELGAFFLSALAVFLCALVHWISPVVLKRLITSPEIYWAVIQYLDWRSLGLLFSFPFLAFRSFFVGITQTKALLWAAAATTGSLVSNAIGAGQGQQLFPVCNKILRLGYAIGFPLVVLALLDNRFIIGLYTDNALLAQQAVIPFIVTVKGFASPDSEKSCARKLVRFFQPVPLTVLRIPL